MNPDKLFDYLDGKLSAAERAALEERLMSDRQLQRELVVARQIHTGMSGNSREILLPGEEEISERGRKLALRIGIAFMVLVAVNVGAGLWFIAKHESKNPNRALLEAQTREQIRRSLEHAAGTAITPGPLGVSEIAVTTAPGQLDAVANEVVTIVQRLGGSATKGIPEQHRLGVLVDLPANREAEFREKIISIGGAPGSATSVQQPGSPIPATTEKKSFAVEIVESVGTQR